jgi:hypothetical protein
VGHAQAREFATKSHRHCSHISQTNAEFQSRSAGHFEKRMLGDFLPLEIAAAITLLSKLQHLCLADKATAAHDVADVESKAEAANLCERLRAMCVNGTLAINSERDGRQQ